MKLCRSCDTEKNNVMFGGRAASGDGLSAKCKLCQSLYDKERANNPNRVNARAEYAKTPEGIESQAKARKKYVANNKGKIYEVTKSWRERNPNKYRAHGKVAYAIKMGDLSAKSCEVCSEPITEGHHDDYAKALDVRWLCAICHNKWHKENGEGLNP